MKNLGDKMMFTGGAETTPKVKVVESLRVGHEGEQVLEIEQGMESIVNISPDTLRAILKWYDS